MKLTNEIKEVINRQNEIYCEAVKTAYFTGADASKAFKNVLNCISENREDKFNLNEQMKEFEKYLKEE